MTPTHPRHKSTPLPHHGLHGTSPTATAHHHVAHRIGALLSLRVAGCRVVTWGRLTHTTALRTTRLGVGCELLLRPRARVHGGGVRHPSSSPPHGERARVYVLALLAIRGTIGVCGITHPVARGLVIHGCSEGTL